MLCGAHTFICASQNRDCMFFIFRIVFFRIYKIECSFVMFLCCVRKGWRHLGLLNKSEPPPCVPFLSFVSRLLLSVFIKPVLISLIVCVVCTSSPLFPYIFHHSVHGNNSAISLGSLLPSIGQCHFGLMSALQLALVGVRVCVFASCVP